MTEKTRLKGQAELDRFIEHYRADKRSKETITTYRMAMGHMLRFINKEPKDITLDDIENWKRQGLKNYKKGESKNYKKSSIRTYMSVAKIFFKHLDREELAEKITMPKKEKQIPVYLTQNETVRILENAKNNPRDYAILTTFLYEGLRRAELINLNISDIDFENDILKIRSGKGDKDREIPLHPEVKKAIIEYLRYRKENNIMPIVKEDILFVGDQLKRLSECWIQTRVKEYAVKTGIKKNISPHKLRHTALTHWYMNTNDIRFVQKIAGHSKIATTEIYVHTNVNYLKEVMEKAQFSYDRQRVQQPQIPTYTPVDDTEKDKKKEVLSYFG